MSGADRHKGRRRPCCFAFLGIGIFLTILLVIGFVWFYNHPISNKNVHERVLHRLERISGLDVAYDSASLTLATGRYRITNLRFMEQDKPGVPVFTVGEVYATIHPWELLINPESAITEVVLKNPSQLDMVYTPDSVRLGELSRFLMDSVKKTQPPGSDSDGRLPFDEMKIENVEVAFTEAQGILPDIKPEKPSMILSGDMIVTNQNLSALNLSFSGRAERPAYSSEDGITQTMASGLEARVTLGTTDTIAMQGSVEQIALTRMFREMPKTQVRGRDIVFNVKTDIKGTKRTLSGNAKAVNLACINPENQIRITDNNVDLTLDMDFNTSVGVAQIRQASIRSDGAKAGISGMIRYKDGANYNLNLTIARLDDEYRAMLEHLLPKGWDVEANRDALAMNIHVVGSDGNISALEGEMSMRGVTLKMPTLPVALRNMHGNLQFGDEAIKFANVTAEYAGTRVALAGTFSGDPWQTRTGTVDMKWSAAVSLEEVLKLHGGRIDASSEPIAGSGTISGHGTWRQNVNLSNPTESGTPEVEGELNFENVSLKNAMLPAPIAGLSGTARIDDNRLEIENLTGTMQGSELAVDGFMEGDRFFWRDPMVSATLKSRMDLARLGPYLSDVQKKALQKYELSGRANTEMVIKGPLNELGSRFTGAVQISNVSLRPHLDFMNGKFTEISGTVVWDGKSLHLDELSGRLNDETIRLSGRISSKNIELQVKSDTSLASMEATFPYLNKYLDMSGGLTCDVTFAVGKNEEEKPGSLTQVLESARALAENAVNQKTFSLNGDLHLKDATIRHIAMPLARNEDGREIPAGRVTGLTGRVRVNNETLMVPDDDTLACSFSDTPNCRLSGYVKIRPGNFPEMKVKISSAGTMKLDTWVTGWGKGLPRLEKPPMTGKEFNLEAEILAPSVIFRNQEAGRSTAKVLFNMVQNETPRVTEFKDVVIQGNQRGLGRIIGNGQIESFVWDQQHFPRWQASLDVQAMPLESMLAAVFRRPSNLRGMITGKIDLHGVGNNPRLIRGSGSGRMTNLEIGRTAVIRELGQTTGRNFGGMLFQTARAATFEVGNGALSSRDLALETNGLLLEMRGDYWFAGDPARGIPAKTIDGNLRLRLFKSVFGSIPIIGQLADLADEVANAFLLAFRVTGTAEQPRITPVPLPMFQGGS